MRFTEVELTKGFLPIEGTRVLVIGTRHNGFKGSVVEKPPEWSARSIAVLLDEWDEPIKLFRHNIFTDADQSI